MKNSRAGPRADPRREIVTWVIGFWVPGGYINLAALHYGKRSVSCHQRLSERSARGLCESRREIVAGRNGKILPAAVLIPGPITGGTEVGPPGGDFRYWSPPYVGIVQNIMGPGSFPS